MPIVADVNTWRPSMSKGARRAVRRRSATRIASLASVMSSRRTVNSSPSSLASVNPAAVSRDDVRPSKTRLKAARHRHEQPIGAEHAQALIEHLESIEAEDKERKDVVAAALRALDRAIEHIEEEQPVRQAGERIGHLRIRDVGQRPREPCRAAGSVGHGGAAAPHPPVRAVAMQKPVLAFVVAASALEVRVERVLHPRGVLMVNAREPLVWMRADFLFLVPEQRFPPRRPVHLVRRDIPVPETVVRAPYGDRVSLFAFMQVGHGPFVREVRADAGQRNREIDRLGDVVVCAKAERFDDIGALRPAGHHDDRQLRLRMGLPEPCQHLETAHAWHLDVQQHEIVPIGRRALQRFFAARGAFDDKAFLDETPLERVAVELGIVDDEKRAQAGS